MGNAFGVELEFIFTRKLLRISWLISVWWIPMLCMNKIKFWDSSPHIVERPSWIRLVAQESFPAERKIWNVSYVWYHRQSMLRFLCESKNKMLNRISFNGNWKGNWRFELEEVGWMLGSVAASAKLSFKYLQNLKSKQPQLYSLIK